MQLIHGHHGDPYAIQLGAILLGIGVGTLCLLVLVSWICEKAAETRKRGR